MPEGTESDAAMRRATRRPAHVRPPEHWQRDDGPPVPAEVPFTPREEKGRPDPVRYGDWERGGIAVDF
ncbi:MAG: DUF1674 domain-containing protein [Sphingopyxis sp.]